MKILRQKEFGEIKRLNKEKKRAWEGSTPHERNRFRYWERDFRNPYKFTNIDDVINERQRLKLSDEKTRELLGELPPNLSRLSIYNKFHARNEKIGKYRDGTPIYIESQYREALKDRAQKREKEAIKKKLINRARKPVRF